LSTAAIALALAARQRSRRRQRRAEELLRVGQVARLNTMGELAGGVAHELNQPLAAMLANTQAARRLLADDPPDLETALGAMEKASTQARRAAEVLARLRRLVEAPGAAPAREAVPLMSATRHVIDLLSPQLRAQDIVTSVNGPDAVVLADPVALEQIVHNLVNNAMQALEAVPAVERGLELRVDDAGDVVRLTVSDTGPGIAPERMGQLFQPFQSTRRGGLGLGLSLSQSLAEAMDGTLTARHAEPRGAVFVLQLQRYRPTP
jgi:C4-dicarboxylate-specific signal transduction histidine kinase